MAQQQWRVNGFSGRSYLIGLYHGDRSGHLLVYCNNKILLTEFNVKESKDYSFFLDDELFQLHLARENQQFSYQLIHNEEIDTPHNREKAKTKKTDRWKIGGILLAGIFFLVVVIGILSDFGKEKEKHFDILHAGGGHLTTVLISEQKGQLVAQYPAEGQLYNEPLPPTDTISTLGFPIIPGQQFSARYMPAEPKHMLIEWARPNREVLDQYKLLTAAKHVQLHPELAPQIARCQVRIAFKMKGLQGLALLYGQDRHASHRYHEYKYLRFVRSNEFRTQTRECL